MPRKGENIYKRKDGRWEGRYVRDRIDNRAVYGYLYAKTYADVRSKLQKKRYEVAKKENKPSDLEQTDVLFDTVAHQWLESLQTSIKLSSYNQYSTTLSKLVYPYLGKKKISEIDYKTVLDFCNTLQKSGGAKKQGISPKTVFDALTIVKSVLKYASKTKICIDRTAFDVSVHLKAKPLRVLSLQEQQKLLEMLPNDLVGLGIRICMFTGIRVGELAALQWEDISFTENLIRITKTMQRTQVKDGVRKTAIQITKPKSQSSIRDVPIANYLQPFLLQHRKESGFVLTGKKDQSIEPRRMQDRFQTILKEADIKNAHFHTLRHSFATRCIEVGCDPKSLSEILGHANVNITLNRYVHPSMSVKHQSVERLSELFAVR